MALTIKQVELDRVKGMEDYIPTLEDAVRNAEVQNDQGSLVPKPMPYVV